VEFRGPAGSIFSPALFDRSLPPLLTNGEALSKNQNIGNVSELRFGKQAR
jgi:hypothetical protein